MYKLFMYISNYITKEITINYYPGILRSWISCLLLKFV